LQLFLEHGADPNAVSKNIQTPLHFGYDVWLATPPSDALKKAVALDIAKSVIKLLLNVGCFLSCRFRSLVVPLPC
jgi:ankyrin repeat protein